MRLSVAIPTRERAEFLEPCLRTLAAVADSDLEIVVSDNASTDKTRAVVEAANDRRIRYVNTGRRVSQRQNFDFAIAATTGDYVMMIGDDDAVLAGQWPRLRAILAQHRPTALSWPSVFYQWPGLHKRGGGGRLRLSRAYLNGNVVIRTAQQNLAALCQLVRSREDCSPKLYHGFLSRSVLEALKARTGAYLMSGQADAYISAAAAAILPDYAYIRHPFSMLAMGPMSGGSAVAAQHRAADRNITARLVAEEAERDPVLEPLAMPFPVLGFYLLNGLEQANRHVFRGDLRLDYAAYFSMILQQLEQVGIEARQRGLDLMRSLAVELPQSGSLLAMLADCEGRLIGKRVPRSDWVKPSVVRFFESLSMIEPGRIGIDLKPRGLARVDGAARLADFLIGSSESAVLDADQQARLWHASLARAVRVIGLGYRP
ncbi:Glyco_tranf_GTA_type domain containing protein [Rhabdaerophilaceae bacterium]